jgi:ketol-acid reductoisomerase
MPSAEPDFTSAVFDTEHITLGGQRETTVRGDRHLFARLPVAFEGVQQIAVIGWGSQGRAQAQNLRDSLGGAVKVVVGLRAGSSSAPAAREAGFTEESGTLGEMFGVIAASDMVLLLISDAAQAECFREVFHALRPGATLGLSHGFLGGHLSAIGEDFPPGVDVVAVCPKGMGLSVRALYVQGGTVNGAGINAGLAVHQDVSGRAVERALGWSIALGAPVTFRRTLESEYVSDLTGERAILLAGVHGIVESLYRRYLGQGMTDAEAYRHSVESVTGPISTTISTRGLIGLYEQFDDEGRAEFADAYAAAYPVGTEIIAEIYDEVSLGNEIRSVVLAGQRLARFPLARIDQADMWRVGRQVRAERGAHQTPLNPFTAGVFCGVMMAQVDFLMEQDHPCSEIANESVIEAVDSLNPCMHARGIGYMIENCSTTARLGARKWAPRFDCLLTQTAYPAVDSNEVYPTPFDSFESHVIHDILSVCATMRPSVDRLAA